VREKKKRVREKKKRVREKNKRVREKKRGKQRGGDSKCAHFHCHKMV
jgi:hypothetical protein